MGWAAGFDAALVAGVVGQNIVLEGMAFSVFEMMQAMNREMNPTFAKTLSGTIADERRHVGFGENRIGSLLEQHQGAGDGFRRQRRDRRQLQELRRRTRIGGHGRHRSRRP